MFWALCDFISRPFRVWTADVYYWLAVSSLIKATTTQQYQDALIASNALHSVITRLPSQHPRATGFLVAYSSILGLRAAKSFNYDLLDTSIYIAQLAIEVWTERRGRSELGGLTFNLALLLERRYKQRHGLDDLEQAITLNRHALELLPTASPPSRAAKVSLLNLQCRWVFETRSSDNYRDALRCIFDESLGSDAFTSVELRLVRFYLNLLTLCASDILAEADEGGMRVPEYSDSMDPWAFHDLGVMLLMRFKRVSDTGLIDRALRYVRLSLESRSSDIQLRTTAHETLGHTLLARYDQTGDLNDLERSIASLRQAVKLPGQPSDPGSKQYLLGMTLLRQHERFGDKATLKEALQLLQQAVDADGLDPFTCADWMSNLGSAFWRLYGYSMSTRLLFLSISIVHESAELLGDKHPGFPAKLDSLSKKLQTAYDRTGEEDILNDAVHYAKEAVRSTHIGDPKLPVRLNTLGNKLFAQFKSDNCQDTGMFDEAIRVNQLAVDITPTESLLRPTWLGNLSIKTLHRYKLTGEKIHLQMAEELAVAAVEQTCGRPESAGWLYNLGSIHLVEKDDCSESALNCFLQGWCVSSASASERVRCLQQALPLLLERKAFTRAYHYASQAVSQIRLLTTRFLNSSDQQYVISQFEGLVSLACSLALQLREPQATALAILEQGRHVILSNVLDDHSDLSALRKANPGVCDKLELLLHTSQHPPDEVDELATMSRAVIAHTEAVAALDTCLEEIRELDGFENFRRPLSPEEIRGAGGEVPIVIVNVSSLRSDAFFIVNDRVEAMPLPYLKQTEAQKWLSEQLPASLDPDFPGGVPRHKKYFEFLRWLWEAAVKPCLNYLGLNGVSDPKLLPRLHWIGAGLAATLPFHAAGDYANGSLENAFEYCVSSYTPTITALRRARQYQVRSFEDPGPNMLLVTLQNAGEWPLLEGVARERDVICEEVRGLISMDLCHSPTVGTILDRMTHADIVDFACHGHADARVPSQSGLVLLADNYSEERRESEVLTLDEIANANLRQGFVAYLSACSTAENKSGSLADEALHVAAGFQAAGFRHVVASLWPAGDEVSVDMARGFYQYYVNNMDKQHLDAVVARAVHHATTVVRKSEGLRKRPLYWVNYVHFGT